MSNTNTDIVLAGAAAAFTIDLLIYPLDTIKTRYQSQDYLKTYAQKGTKQSASTAFRGLYQGVGSVIVATLPAAGIFFTTYESAKTFYSGILGPANRPDGLTVPAPVIHSMASATAELASCVVLTPAEVIKQNAQMIRSAAGAGPKRAGGGQRRRGPHPARGSWWRDSTSVRALRMVSQGNGAAHRLLTGYSALVARNLPFTAIQFPIFEAVRRAIWDRRDGAGGESVGDKGAVARGMVETGCVNGASAAVSGAISAVITTPTDVVKTRMMLFAGEDKAAQAGGGGGEERSARELGSKGGAKAKNQQTTPATAKKAGASGGRQKLGTMQVARMVYQERGIKGLFRGGLLRAGWTALGSGLYLGTYEVAKVWLKGPDGNGDDDVL